MADGPDIALQGAVIARCRSLAAITALVGARSYDEPPDQPTYPFLRMGDIDVRPARSDGCLSWDLLFVIEVHSRPNQGRIEAARIAQALVEAFDETSPTLSVAGFAASWVHFVTSVVTRDPDGKTYQARVVFETMLTAAP